MYTSTIALAIAPLLYLAHADVSLDRDDVPRACDTICDPIVQLTQKCDSDRWGDAQEIQCVCTNDSFNVERIAALCANCIHQNASQDRDDDDDDDNDIRDETENIDDILFTCAFPSTTYVASAASAAVSGISVDASLPTDGSEFTWIIGGTTTRDSNQATSTNGSGGSGGNSNNNNNNNDNASATNDASSPDETNAAAAMAPVGVLGAVVGAAMLLA
ncbi:Ff.00g018370.m01.CDS01 [Fusarium sp. VM40]|nr:Ff.00g018370.m01.CDS01 [Fusarium sp. VM40]